jgi:hypothetical protein
MGEGRRCVEPVETVWVFVQKGIADGKVAIAYYLLVKLGTFLAAKWG